MKIQGKMFIWLSVFFLAVAVVYGVWSKEPVGTTALVLAFGLSIMIGFYLGFTARRVDVGAQDNKEADVADDAGRGRVLQPAQLAAAVPGRGRRPGLHGRGDRLVADVLLRAASADRSVGLGLRVLPR